MEYIASNNLHFLTQVEQFIERHGEVLVLFRYARMAGAKDFMFFHDMLSFQSKLEGLAPHTNVIVYGERQLPLRGKVDDVFVQRALEVLPENVEYLLLCLEKTVHDYRPHHYWESFDYSAGETHAELREDLDEYRGRLVALGAWPPWPGGNEHTIEAYVPDQEGRISPGPY